MSLKTISHPNLRLGWRGRGLSVLLGGLDHCCLVVERADPGIKSESSLVDFSSSVTVKKRRQNILPAIKVLTFEKLDVNHFRGQRVNFQVGLIAKKITSTGYVPY